MRNRLLFIVSLLLISSFLWSQAAKPRIIVTADPELDDNNSLIRFLLYSDQFDIDGLIYASSQFHWKGDGKGTTFMVNGREYTRYGLNLCPCESYRWRKDERFIHDAVDAYEKVYHNLLKHNSNYPQPGYLRSKIKYGNIEFEGEFSKDTEGSEWIKAAILDNRPGPLFITAWGGQSTIARALKSIEEQFEHSPEWISIKARISKKVVLLPSGDQDGTYASYIKPNWPEIDYRQFRNGPNYGYGAQLVANEINGKLLTSEWMWANVRSKGPLGDMYRVWGDGKQMVKGDRFDYFGMDGYTDEQLKKMGYIVWMPVQKKGSWLGEGDTPTFMNLVMNGLHADEQDALGGWGGRPFYPDMQNFVDPFSNDTSKNKDLVISASSLQRMSGDSNEKVSYPNFFPAAQHDFAVRLDWSVQSTYRSSNHHPILTLKGERDLSVKPGETIELEVMVNDPDGNHTQLKWWPFIRSNRDPRPTLSSTETARTFLTVPETIFSPIDFFIVAEVQDDGRPSLTSYQRIRIRVRP